MTSSAPLLVRLVNWKDFLLRCDCIRPSISKHRSLGHGRDASWTSRLPWVDLEGAVDISLTDGELAVLVRARGGVGAWGRGQTLDMPVSGVRGRATMSHPMDLKGSFGPYEWMPHVVGDDFWSMQ